MMNSMVKRLTFICVGILGGVLSSMIVADNGKFVSVTVVISQDSGPYQQVLSGFKQYLADNGVRADYNQAVLDDGLLAPETLSHNGIGGQRLFLTIGARATEVILDRVSDVPVIAALAHDFEKLESADNATGTLLTHPIKVHFEYMKLIMPGVQRVGVLFNPLENAQVIEKTQSIAREFEIDLVLGRVEKPSELPVELRYVANAAQVIWSIDDHMVYVSETAKYILVYSFRNRVPIIGLSEYWTKAGALYSLERDYFDVGAQCGKLAGKIIDGTPVRSIPPEYPRKVIYMLNLKTAQHMKLDISPSIIAGASKVFE